MQLKIITFAIILIITKCDNIVQAGELWEYSYFAETSIGNEVLNKASTKWILSGKLLIYSYEKYKIFKLEKLKTWEYNGPHNEMPDAQLHDLPNNADILLEPFVTNYDKYYNALKTINFQPEDPVWSMNIKKSIASLYQVNIKANLAFDGITLEDVPDDIFQQTEMNIFGACTIQYNITKTNDKLNIFKNINPYMCADVNSTRLRWHRSKVGYFNSETMRHYIYDDENSNIESNKPINKIISMTNMQFTKLKSEQFGHGLNQIITLTLENSAPVDNNFDVTKYTKEKFPVYEDDHFTPNTNLSGEQQIYNLLLQYKSLKEYLSQTSLEFYNENTFKMIENLYNQMSSMNSEALDQFLTNKFADENQMLFHFTSLMPYIGTDGSIKFLKTLLKNKNYNDFNALAHIFSYPFRINTINENILANMEEYIKPNKSHRAILHHTYILSYSNLVSRIYDLVDELEPQPKLMEIIQRYVDLYYKYFQEVENQNTRIQYLLGLGNMGNLARNNLISIIKNQTESRHIRSLAIYTVKPFMKDRIDNKEFRDFWKTVINKCNPFELRVAALSLLLDSNVDYGEYYSMYKYMDRNTNDPEELHIYNYFYSSLNCNKSHQINSARYNFLRDLKVDFQAPSSMKGLLTGTYFSQYSDATQNFRTSLETHIVANPITNFVNAIKISFDEYINKYNKIQSLSVYVKAEGISKFLKSSSTAIPIKELIEILEKYKLESKSEEFYFEFVCYYKDKAFIAVSLSDLDYENKHFLLDFLDDIVQYFVQNERLQFDYLDKYDFTSDLGTPVKAELKYENLYVTHLDFPTDRISNKKYAQGHVRRMTVEKTDLKFLNPLTTIPHGVSSIYSRQYEIKYKIEHNISAQYFSWNDEDNSFEYVTDRKDILYTNIDDNAQEYCLKCTPIYFLTTQTPTVETKKGYKVMSEIFVNCSKSKFDFSKAMVESRIINSGVKFLEPILILSYINDYKKYITNKDTCSRKLNINVKKQEPKEYILYYYKDINVNAIDELNFNTLQWNLTMNLEKRNLSDDKQLISTEYLQFTKNQNKLKFEFNDTAELSHFVIYFETSSYPQLIAKNTFSLLLSRSFNTANVNMHIYKNNKQINEIEIHSKVAISERKLDAIKNSVDYEKCKADSSVEFTDIMAPTKSCIDVSNRLSIYDEFSTDLEIKVIDNKSNSIENEFLILESNKISVKYSALNGVVRLFKDDKEFKRYTVPEIYRSKLYPRINAMRHILGIESSCIITKSYVKTFTESTVPYKYVSTMVPLIECNNNSRMGLITIHETNSIGFKFWHDGGILSVDAKDDKSLKFNNDSVTEDIENDFFSLKFYNDSILITTKQIEIFYYKHYISIKIESFLINEICGICSSGQLTASNLLLNDDSA